MTNENFQDLVDADIQAVETQIDQVGDDLIKAKEKISEANTRKRSIENRLESLRVDLSRAKKQAITLKKFVWQSDNPSIVELRNQLLLVAKLTNDFESKGKK